VSNTPSDDELKAVLGDLWDELTGPTVGDAPHGVLERILATTFLLEMPIAGADIFDMTQTAIHAAQDGCEECSTYLFRWTINFIASAWEMVLIGIDANE
jgi:hypothetical protein